MSAVHLPDNPCDCKTVDNALQRIKRKVDLHLEGRKVLG